MELLVSTLQLFSNHQANYAVIEPQHYILGNFVLFYPCFRDASLKVLVLKTLEFVCTGVSDARTCDSLEIGAEMFSALAEALLKRVTIGGSDAPHSDDLYRYGSFGIFSNIRRKNILDL